MIKIAVHLRCDSLERIAPNDSAHGGRPLIAHGAGAREPMVLNEAAWLEIRKRIEEVA